MSKLGGSDYRTIIFVAAALILMITALLFADAGDSRRALGGLVLGPALVVYGGWHFRKGAFPEIALAKRGHPTFWYLFVTFVLSGLGTTFIGLSELFARIGP